MKKIRVQDVADMLHIDPQTVRIMLQRNLVPFGIALKKDGNRNWSYIIFPEKLKEYVKEGAAVC